MRCPENKKLVEFALKSLTEKEMDAILLHLNECSKCLTKINFFYHKYKHCPETETLCMYARGEIDNKNEQKHLENHINSCEICKKLFLQAQEAWEILSEDLNLQYFELWDKLQKIRAVMTTRFLFKVYLSKKLAGRGEKSKKQTKKNLNYVIL